MDPEEDRQVRLTCLELAIQANGSRLRNELLRYSGETKLVVESAKAFYEFATAGGSEDPKAIPFPPLPNERSN